MTRPAGMLIARDSELAVLAEETKVASARGPRAVLVTGRSGSGKSALVAAASARHEGGSRWARAARWESDLPFGVLQQLVGEQVWADVGSPVEAARQLARTLPTRPGVPVMIVVDDAQWADVVSLQAIDSLVRHHPRAGVVVVLAADVEASDAAPTALDLLRRTSSTVLPLGPLTTAQVGEVASAHGVLLHPSVTERLWSHTGGVAGHVVQLLSQVPRPVWGTYDPDLPAPATVAAEVTTALRTCSPPARRVAQAVAVLGQPSSTGVVAALAEVEDFVPALHEARTAGLVAWGLHGHTELVPGNAMVRAAVLEVMGLDEVVGWSKRAAAVVPDPVHRLRLLVAASPLPDPGLADRLDDAAGRLAAEGAWGSAAGLLIDASRLTEDQLLRERRLTRAVDALVGAGEAMGAAALTPEVESLRETPLRNAVLGYLAIVRGRGTEAESRLERAWDLVNADREPAVAASICQRFVLHHLARCRAEELVRWADRAVQLVGPGEPAALESQAIRGLGLLSLGRAEEAVAAYRELGEQVPSGAQRQRVTMGRGWLDLMLGDVEDARAELESAVPTTFHGGSARISLWARAWLARAQFRLGEWPAALRTVEQGLELLDRTGIVLAGPLLRWTEVQVHALRGAWDRAEEALRRLDAAPQDYEIMRIPACLAQAALAEARADYEGVLRALHPLTGALSQGGVDEPGQWPWPDVYANALVIEGRLDEAAAFLDQHEERARCRGQEVVLARLGYARGRLLGARGDLDGARRVFERSLTALESRPLRYDRARASFAYGQTLRRAGRRREADTVISTARDLFSALGAHTYVARCERELKAGGVRVQRGERSAEDLTPQEEAVATLVAKGRSNREVASELFLSVKTVQYHLTRIYAKLGIRSRSELAALRAPTPGADEAT